MSVTDLKKGAAAAAWIALSVTAYIVAYLAASSLDLWTTELALQSPGASEANVFATDDGLYAATKAWAITLAGGVIMVALFAFGVANAERVSGTWLRRPLRSFLYLYLNPWSKRVIDRSPLHAVSYAVAFVVLRVLAAANNMFIVAGVPGPIGAAVRAVAARTSPEIGFATVAAALYIALVVALSPLGAKIIGLHRSATHDERKRPT